MFSSFGCSHAWTDSAAHSNADISPLQTHKKIFPHRRSFFLRFFGRCCFRLHALSLCACVCMCSDKQLLMKFEDYVDEQNAGGAAVVGYDGFNADASVRDLLDGLCREVGGCKTNIDFLKQGQVIAIVGAAVE